MNCTSYVLEICRPSTRSDSAHAPSTGAEQGSGAQLAKPSATPQEGPGHEPTCMATRAGQSRRTSAWTDVSRARTVTAVLGGSRRGHCEAVNVAPGTAFPSMAIEYSSPA